MKNNAPLSSIRVVDLSHSWAAPHCSRILADYGAEVIKIEYIRRLCLLRGARKDAQIYNSHPAWLHVNRNKYSMTLDLHVEHDRIVLQDLVKTADVLIENSRTGVMDRLGFGYHDLVKIKKDLVVLSMPAFGATGPYASYAGYGAIMESVSGIQSLTAYEKGSRPFRIKELDVTNGIMGACAVMTALVDRQRTGRGQHIDLSQMEAPTHGLIGEHLLLYHMQGTQTHPVGNRHWTFAPQGCYRCKGEDSWITLTIRSDEEWCRFCRALRRPAWAADERFASNTARKEHHDLLDRMIEEWTIAHTHYEAMRILQDHHIAAGAVLNVSELAEERHLLERNYYLREETGSPVFFMGMPFKMSEGGETICRRGPHLGEHNEYVLCELLGRSKDEVQPVREEDIGTAYDLE